MVDGRFLFGGCGGGPRFTREAESLTELDSCCCCFFCFFNVKCFVNSAFKSSTIEPVDRFAFVFCGLPIDDVDDGDSLGGDLVVST